MLNIDKTLALLMLSLGLACDIEPDEDQDATLEIADETPAVFAEAELATDVPDPPAGTPGLIAEEASASGPDNCVWNNNGSYVSQCESGPGGVQATSTGCYADSNGWNLRNVKPGLPDTLPNFATCSFEGAPLSQQHTIALCCGPNEAFPIGECEYRRNSGTGTVVSAACIPGTFIMAGGCFHNGNGFIRRSAPFEWGNTHNLPDHGEAFDRTDGTTGWMCQRDLFGSTMWASALCCDPDPGSGGGFIAPP